MYKELWTLQNRNIHHLIFDEPLDARNLVASVPNDNPESLARANRIVADHNALAGLNPDAIKELVEAAEKFVQYYQGSRKSYLGNGQAYKSHIALEQALKNLKGE